jgi:hypothetical protein
VVVLSLALLGACGRSKSETPAPIASSTTTTPASNNSNTDESVKAAALAYARAYLSGSATDLYNMQGPECRSDMKLSTDNKAAADDLLREMRQDLEQQLGMPARAIEAKILGVVPRNVTATTADAEVRYGLPESVTGNDNWVTYERINGSWKVQNCHAPIGGSGGSSSGAQP